MNNNSNNQINTQDLESWETITQEDDSISDFCSDPVMEGQGNNNTNNKDIPSSSTSSEETKNLLRQFFLPFLSKQSGMKRYESFFTEKKQNPETYQTFVQKYFKKQPKTIKPNSKGKARITVSKNALKEIWSLPTNDEDYNEAFFFRSLVGKYTLERFLEMLKNNMDSLEQQSIFIKWFKSLLKEQLIHLGKMQEK